MLLWKYSGFAIEMHSSADHRSVKGGLQKERGSKSQFVESDIETATIDSKNLLKSDVTTAPSNPLFQDLTSLWSQAHEPSRWSAPP